MRRAAKQAYAEAQKRIRKAVKSKAKGLDLSILGLTSLPPELGKLTSLTELNLFNNQLTALPPELGNLTSLTWLGLDNNHLTTLPPELGKLTSLTMLYVRGNQLTALPPELGNLTSLTTLSLAENLLTALPPELGNLTGLTGLILFDNQLTALPPELGNLTRLTDLYLYKNQLTALPPELGNLTSLTALYLSNNQLTALPPELGNLTHLTGLSLYSNHLTALPPELGKLEKLEQLYLRGNPLTSPPPEVVGQGTGAVLAYLRDQEKGARPQWISKLVLVGEGGVGKSATLRSLLGLGFDPELPTTHGIAVERLGLKHPSEPGVVMRLNSWDFGGQQIYHATHQFFLTNRSLFALVWDTRAGWERGRLYHWLDTIHALAPDSPVVIVAAHLDERTPDSPLSELKNKYPQVVRQCEISNKTGQGIDELRTELARAAAGLPLMGKPWPVGWLAAAEAIRVSGERHTTPGDLDKSVGRHGVEGDSARALRRCLHEIGDLLFFEDVPELSDIVILKPQWVSDHICRVLDSQEVERQNGILTAQHRDQLWSDIPGVMREHFLRMMEKFDLSYRTMVPQEVSLVVERLPMVVPDYQPRWDSVGGLQVAMRWSLNTLPPGIPTWFIARHHPYSTHTRWRAGGLFTDSSRRHVALVKADSHARTVELAVRGPLPYAFFVKLRRGMEFTLDRFPGLKVERLIPCPGHGDRPCGHAFRYDNLVRRIMSGPAVPKIECEESGEQLLVADLLFGLHWRTCDDVFGRIEGYPELSVERQDLLPLIQDKVSAIHTSLQKYSESHCPDVFTLRLEQQSGLGKALTGQKAELQLYCQWPAGWHPTDPGGRYAFPIPPEWLDVIAPHVRYLVRTLKLLVPAAAVGYAVLNPQLAQRARDDVKAMAALAECLPEPTESHAAEAVRAVGGTRHAPEPASGATIRALRKLLDELDRYQVWGGLEKAETSTGDYLWLCPEHAAKYRMPTAPAD